MVSTIPPMVKYNPFLNIEVAGINIQKEDITKNNSDKPKKIFSQKIGLSAVALCRCSILSKMNGSFLTIYSALPVREL